MAEFKTSYGIDNTTKSNKTIEYEHSEIHEGNHFNYCDYQENIALNDNIEFVLTTSDTTKAIHFNFEVYSSLGCKIEVYEAASGVSGGTTITPRNNNRNSNKLSTITLIKDPSSISNDGTRAAGYLAGAGRSSGFYKRENELLLKTNTIYLLRITSSANSNNISWCGEWYEHINE